MTEALCRALVAALRRGQVLSGAASLVQRARVVIPAVGVGAWGWICVDHAAGSTVAMAAPESAVRWWVDRLPGGGVGNGDEA